MSERAFNDVSYEQFLNEKKVMGSKCKKCGALSVPPRPICVECHSSEMEWAEMKGKGKLAAFTCISVGPPSMVEEGYDRKNPYCTGVVELEEGPRVVARINGVDTKTPESIKVGLPVTAEFMPRGEGESLITILAFKS